MKINLDHEKRMTILAALRYFKDAEQVKNSTFRPEIINSLFQELQPTGVAIDAEVGDFVMFEEECREVASLSRQVGCLPRPERPESPQSLSCL